ncbi:MAG: helix-turn-helix transcriptional regulator, partial [Acidobacteriaceae bacterium]|nr:helix-turn-helix transcriptional regulator [Acidobacteriaceae bacterium]
MRAIEILHVEFREPVNLPSLANRVGTHPVHLARTFKRHRGKPIGDYVRELRVSHALEALTNTRKSLAEIASESGFSDQSHFGRVIKAHTGL